MALVTDNFTGTAGTTLESHDANWVVHPSRPASSIVLTDANRCRPNAGNNLYYRSEDPGSDDYPASIDVVVFPVSDKPNAIGVVVRQSTTDLSSYRAQVDIDGTVDLHRMPSGGGQVSLGSVAITPVNGRITCEATGTTIKARFQRASDSKWLKPDGTYQVAQIDAISVTDANIAARGKMGVNFQPFVVGNSDALNADNFSGGVFSPVDPGDASFTASTTTSVSMVATAAANTTGSVSYLWQYSLNNSAWSDSDQTAASPATITGLTPDTLYYFRRRLIDDTGTYYSDVISTETVEATAWDPTADNDAVGDTTLGPLDATAELAKTTGVDGPINGAYPTSYTNVVATTGRFSRDGFIQNVAGSGPGIWWPIEGIIGEGEFNVNFNVANVEGDWSTKSNSGLIIIGNDQICAIGLRIDAGLLTLQYVNNQVYPSVSTSRTTTISASVNEWVNIDLNRDADGEIRIAVEGVDVTWDSPGALMTPDWVALHSSEKSYGLQIFANATYSGFVVSDLQVHRYARTIGALSSTPDPSITIDPDTETGTVNKLLPGTNHWTGETIPPKALRSRIGESTKTIRLGGKFLQCTPIKSGAPDGSHPTLGVSGNWSFDWTDVDNELSEIVAAGITEIYFYPAYNCAATGGAATTDSQGYPSHVPADTSTPNNWANYAELTVDLLDHIATTFPLTIRYAAWWNEPENFWGDTLAELLAGYAAVMAAIVAYDPTIKCGGMDGVGPGTDGNSELIEYAADNPGTPLDFTSYHNYNGMLASWSYAHNRNETLKATHGFAGTLELIEGEDYWDNYGEPWTSLNYVESDWQASFRAAQLITEHGHLVYSVLYHSGFDPSDFNGTFTGGLVSDDNVGVNFNVHKLWQMLGDDLIDLDVPNPWPGVWMVATKHSDGTTRIFITYLRYLKDKNVTLNIAGLTAGASVTRYLIDDSHSNFFDAGDAHMELETAALSGVDGSGSLAMTLEPRSVHLLIAGETAGLSPALLACVLEDDE